MGFSSHKEILNRIESDIFLHSEAVKCALKLRHSDTSSSPISSGYVENNFWQSSSISSGCLV